MSTNLSKQIHCPSCGKTSTTRMWPGIDRQQNPEQRERILEESLFCWECPDCGYKMQLLYPCLYHDREKQFLLLLDPNPKEPSLDRKMVAEQKLPGTKKRLVGCVEEMKEKLLIFESGLNDAACELAKLAVAQNVEHRKGVAPLKGYFSQAKESKNEITFAFFFEDEELEPLYQTTRYDVYRKTLEIAQSLHFNECADDFLRVDQEMAKLMLEEYQNR
ncbi:MAG: CpXC domain-containing protein [Oscillospiraceae bacterium]|nr:CpXC domain-containing protein [Oscillospiraceae bacterium]